MLSQLLMHLPQPKGMDAPNGRFEGDGKTNTDGSTRERAPLLSVDGGALNDSDRAPPSFCFACACWSRRKQNKRNDTTINHLGTSKTASHTQSNPANHAKSCNPVPARKRTARAQRANPHHALAQILSKKLAPKQKRRGPQPTPFFVTVTATILDNTLS